MQQTMHDIMYTGHFLQQTSQNMYIKLHESYNSLYQLNSPLRTFMLHK